MHSRICFEPYIKFLYLIEKLSRVSLYSAQLNNFRIFKGMVSVWYHIKCEPAANTIFATDFKKLVEISM